MPVMAHQRLIILIMIASRLHRDCPTRGYTKGIVMAHRGAAEPERRLIARHVRRPPATSASEAECH